MATEITFLLRGPTRSKTRLLGVDCLHRRPHRAFFSSLGLTDTVASPLPCHLARDRQGSSQLTGLNWGGVCSLSQDEVGYKCFTCGTKESSIVCEACFVAGDHEGHDVVERCASRPALSLSLSLSTLAERLRSISRRG